MRVDERDATGAWAHSYARTAAVGSRPPSAPFAVHLAEETGAFRLVVFDLDAHHGRTPEAVEADRAVLARLLDKAGLAHFTAASGPGGGRHVWVPVSGEDGADPGLVAEIAAAAATLLPSLDTAPLTNPATGCVRPPGAPHRSGGCAELLDLGYDDALALCDTPTNTPARLERLLDLLPAPPDAAADSAVEGRIDRVAVRLHGRRRAMPALVRELLDTPPQDDASAHLARILPRLALARWALADVEELLAAEPDAPGLEHVRTRALGRGRRPRTPEDRAAVLARQWTRAVEFAACLGERAPAAAEEGGRNLTGLVTTAAAVVQRTEHAAGWTVQAGPSDRKALAYVVLQALLAGTDEVAIDCRRLALACGMGKSTAARALNRLCADGRLAQAAAAEGTQAARYRLTDPNRWPARGVLEEGGTQGKPAPPAQPSADPPLTRDGLATRLRTRLGTASHDVWAEHAPHRPPGLGRHVEQTHAALVREAENTDLYAVDLLDRLVSRTGYTPARTEAHLRILERHRLLTTAAGPDERRAAALDAAAERLGTTGTADRRSTRYEAERAAYAAWQAEVELLRTPVALRERRERGRTRYPRCPASGRPDHGAAARRVLAAAA